jgi:hypothetical protein
MFEEDTLVPLGFFMALAFIIVSVAKIVSDGRMRRRLIDANVSPELAKAINVAPRDDPGLFGALKWGLETGAIGLALIIIQFTPYRSGDPIMLGVILVFAAAGLLAYYVTAKRLASQSAASGPQ